MYLLLLSTNTDKQSTKTRVLFQNTNIQKDFFLQCAVLGGSPHHRLKSDKLHKSKLVMPLVLPLWYRN